MSKKKANEYFHVYILVSKQQKGLLKVGKTNNLRRTKHLARMGYAGRSDWTHVASFPVQSSQDALALESMVNAKLTNQGQRVPRMPWINLINSKRSYADECFNCSVEHAISVALKMSELVQTHIKERPNPK